MFSRVRDGSIISTNQNLTSYCSGGHYPRSEKNEASKLPLSHKLYTVVLASYHLSDNVIMLLSYFSLWYLKDVCSIYCLKCWTCFASWVVPPMPQPCQMNVTSKPQCALYPAGHISQLSKSCEIRSWLLLNSGNLLLWFLLLGVAFMMTYRFIFQYFGNPPFYLINLFRVTRLD